MASQAYYEAGGVGDWYEAVATTAAGESPVTHPAKWRKLEIPHCLEATIVSLALAFIQRGEGQADKALAEARLVESDMERLMLQHGDFGTLTQPSVFSR